ncbi:MAG TPA: hypothetical protein VGQ66_06425 [Candidatus Limnocylindria bacterium]|jgi:hypothetical protein|nr:hypothetical protein [Candidatus Limnocylindria bacterium]
MAGTMPHAIFVETGIDDGATVAAYAAELPGCAVFAASDVEATNEMPRRVGRFVDWLRAAGESAPTFVGDNWYEVERAAAGDGQRASFSLDDLPPSDDEFDRYLHWLELARELLADRLDAAGDAAPAATLERIASQDLALAAQLGAAPTEPTGSPVDRLYNARDVLTAALEAAGATGDGVRRAVRLAIADDLRLAEQLRGASS